jgi:hypothetical protein
MERHDEEVERYLAEFQPRPVRTLKVSHQTESVWFPGLVAAAAILFVGGISLWHLRQVTKGTKDAPAMRTAVPRSQLNAVALTKLALEDNERFDALLADHSRTVLPSFERENSTLRVLAKE